MTQIDGLERVSLKTYPLSDRVDRRNTEFAQRIKDAVLDVNDRQHEADDATEAVIKGEMGIHEGMLALGRADTSLRLLNQVRSKVMAAYNEIMRMQI